MTTTIIIHVISVFLTGLAAGFFYAYDCSVNKGLGNLKDIEYLAAFKSINKAIINPYFFASFLGTLTALPAAALLSYGSDAFSLLVLSAVIYAVGVFGVTMFGNVPLNNMLDRFEIDLVSDEEIKIMRKKFEPRWNMFHQIRTYAVMIAFLLAILSLMCP